MANEDGLASIETILAAARNGRAFIIVDSSDPDAEGAVVVAAQYATPDRVNFMAAHARGLVCLALTAERARQLKLSLMGGRQGGASTEAFTPAIEAREGVTTGISAYDRALTIAVAMDPSRGAEDIVSPGHVFPVIARDGGVLVRAGHIEAAVDIARLAHLVPAGVVCRIMNEDGEVARLAELRQMADTHDLEIASIADLISYRRRTEQILDRTLERPLRSVNGGDFRLVIYRNRLSGAEHMALAKGEIEPGRPALVRFHAFDLAVDLFGEESDRGDLVPRALRALAAHDGPGAIVFLRNPQVSWTEHYGAAESEPDLSIREFGIGAHMLRDLGVRDMILLTSSPFKLAALDGFGLRILETRPV